MKKPAAALLVLFALTSMPALAVSNPGNRPAGPHLAEQEKGSPVPQEVVTRHSIRIDGRTINYTATAGRLTVSEEGKPQAEIFFIAYFAEKGEAEAPRPITFAFNGGPGASSVWLNFGAFGPKRVLLPQDPVPTPPPYQLVDNEFSLLDETDMVFVDPVGTGYSRPAVGVEAKKFFGTQGDVHSLGEFIRRFVSKFQRWDAPKFIAGESYGTMRAVLLAHYLHKAYGLDLNGLLLVSSALNFETFVFNSGNPLPYVLYLPSYTAAAFYHKRLPAELQTDLRETLQKAQEWAISRYMWVLARGDSLSKEDRQQVTAELSAYTGLSKELLERKNLKVTSTEFTNELLRERGLSVGLLDGRLTQPYGAGGSFFDEPDMVRTIGPYVASLNAYMREELNYETDLTYRYFSREANEQWNWGSAIQGYPCVTDTLRDLIARFKFFKVMIARGYYDLDVPYFATLFNVHGFWLDPPLRNNVTVEFYEGGHQMYTDLSSLRKLKADASRFLRGAFQPAVSASGGRGE